MKRLICALMMGSLFAVPLSAAAEGATERTVTDQTRQQDQLYAGEIGEEMQVDEQAGVIDQEQQDEQTFAMEFGEEERGLSEEERTQVAREGETAEEQDQELLAFDFGQQEQIGEQDGLEEF